MKSLTLSAAMVMILSGIFTVIFAFTEINLYRILSAICTMIFGILIVIIGTKLGNFKNHKK